MASKTNTNKQLFPSSLRDQGAFLGQLIGQIFIVASFLYIQLLPSYALAYTAALDEQPMVFSLEQHIMQPIAPTSYVFTPGTILGVVASAYSSTADQTDGDPFTTASGTKVRQGIIATNFLPLGSRVRINNSIYIVEDRMNARYNDTYHIDIWMTSREAAQQFGVRVVIMEIISLPN